MNLFKDSIMMLGEKYNDDICLVCKLLSVVLLEKGLRENLIVVGCLLNLLENKNGDIFILVIMN